MTTSPSRRSRSSAATIVALATVASLSAQAAAQRVVPAQFATTEGNSTHTYPLGRVTGAVQWLIDAPHVTNTTGVIQAVAFRPNGSLTATSAGYAKAYRVTMHTTPVLAAQMSITPATNEGGRPGTIVFDGVVNVPTAPMLTSLPSPFTLRIPLTPYPFDGTAGNLLMTLETTTTDPTPGTWALDAVSIHATNVTGLATRVGNGCTANGNGVTLAVTATQATLGGAVAATHTVTPPSAFVAGLALLGGTNADPGYPLDLGVLGMPGCTLNVTPAAMQPLGATGGVLDPHFWPIPSAPGIAGATVYVQTLAMTTPASLLGAVTSDTVAVTIGDSTPAPVTVQSIFTQNLITWSIGRVGSYHPVVRLEGVLP